MTRAVIAGTSVRDTPNPVWGHIYECLRCGGLRTINAVNGYVHCPRCDQAAYCGYCGDGLTPRTDGAVRRCLECHVMWIRVNENVWVESYPSDEAYRRAHNGQHG